MRTRTAPAGHSLVELLAALAALGALLAVAGAMFQLASRTARLTADRAEALDATRTAAALLSLEARPLGSQDLVAFPDSVRLRAFRGYGIPCDSSGGAVHLRYMGVRPPDPTKDSILAVTDSAEFAAALSSVSTPGTGGSCVALAGERIFALSASAPLPLAAAWLVYERGTYSIGTGALRYRRGFGGRQPVTTPSFDDAASGFAARTAPAALQLRLAPAHARANSFALPAAVRVPLPNADSVPVP